MWPHFIILKSFLFERKVSYQEHESFDLISIKNIHVTYIVSFIFFLLARSWQKTTIDTSEPYTGAMRDTMHEPQANLRADKKFSPGRSKTQKGGLGKIRVNKK